MNTTTVRFTNGQTAVAMTRLWQYDYGQRLIIEGLDLPTAYEVHFCNAGDSETKPQIGDADGVIIPDEYLENPKDILAYIYLHTGLDDGETEYKITILVRGRQKPTDLEPTPVQQDAITQAIAALNNAVDETAQSVIDAAESEEAARLSEQAAKASEDAAALSETNAAASATAAANSASASSDSASASADSAAVASEKAESAADSEAYVKGVADNIDSLVEAAVEDYLETHPIESAVTSVNGQTGAVTITVPSVAADVGAVAVAQGAAKANQFLVTDASGNVTTKTLESWQAQSY